MPHKKPKYENYLKLIDEALLIAKKLPRYFSRFSNHIYRNHQKFVIVILMQKLKLTTRGVVSFLRSNPAIGLEFGLTKRIPAHTTVVRFFAKVKNIIGLLLDIKQASTVAVDSTGFELETKSFYYRNIDKGLFNRRCKTKQHMKLSIAIDTNTQLILNYKIRKKLRHDTLDFKDLLKELEVKQVLADKVNIKKVNNLIVNLDKSLVVNKINNCKIIAFNHFYNLNEDCELENNIINNTTPKYEIIEFNYNLIDLLKIIVLLFILYLIYRIIKHFVVRSLG